MIKEEGKGEGEEEEEREEKEEKEEPRARPKFPFLYVGLALVWAILASRPTVLAHVSTGVVCPGNPGGWWWFWWPRPGTIPLMMALALDTAGLSLLGNQMRQKQQQKQQTRNGNSVANRLALPSEFLLGGFALFFLLAISAPFSVENAKEIIVDLPHHHMVIRDILVDSCVMAAVVLSGMFLLEARMTPSSLTLLGGAVVISSYHVFRMAEEKGILYIPGVSRASVPLVIGVLAAGCVGFLLYEATRLDAEAFGLPGSDRKWQQYRVAACYTLFIVTMGLSYAHTSIGSTAITSSSSSDDILSLVASAQRTSDEWIFQAGKSESLRDVVAEYKRRYGIPPPPNFDRWFEFAYNKRSPVLDGFDQIQSDLAPFWGLSPAVLRQRTGHLVEQVNLGIGGLRIRNGTIEMSSQTLGAHFVTMGGYRSMLEPFARWLPDMDLAFNLDDECKVAMPAAVLAEQVEAGRKAKLALAQRDDGNVLFTSFSDTAQPPWSDTYLDPDFAATHEDAAPSSLFTSPTHYSTYDLFVAPTCPTDSPALRYRWWDGTTAQPPGRGGVLPSSHPDLCQRPDLARMHGFLLSPDSGDNSNNRHPPYAATQVSFPLFSQSRTTGFNDILVPGPRDFSLGKEVDLQEDRDRRWRDKQDTVFWRGSASDGMARHGVWVNFLRARFVNLARKTEVVGWKGFSGYSRETGVTKPTSTFTDGMTASLVGRDDGNNNNNNNNRNNGGDGVPATNVSFMGDFTRCARSDCRLEKATFYGDDENSSSDSGPMDFQEHWRYRHLIDLDGAGASAHFLPFLRSRSLVYRATIFQTWYDERVHPWRHYIPVDVSLGGLWDLVRFIGRTPSPVVGGVGEVVEVVGDQDGTSVVSLAETIAADGREWARQALRKEDMQVYLFRLLLEWGRLVDDRREEIGFDIFL